MSLHELEEQLPQSLHQLADRISADPTTSAREAVRGRSRRLRRRRQTHRAIGGIGLAAAVIGGGLWLQGDDNGDVKTESPANSPEHWEDWEPPVDGHTLPALTVDVDGLEPVRAYENGGEYEEEAGGPDGETTPPAFQVFRRPGDYAGPTVYLTSGQGIGIPEPGTRATQSVEVAGHEATLQTSNPHVPALGWQLTGDAVVYIRSWQLTTNELLQFASGLQPREGGAGFEATVLPQDIVEQPLEAETGNDHAVRELDLAGPRRLVEVKVNRGGEGAFEGYVSDRLSSADAVEQVVVFNRPAVLTHYTDSEHWSLQWRHSRTARVEVSIEGGDRAWVDEVIAGIQETDEGRWQDLLERYPADAG